jgi:AbrB family looped-hinge helix DNA binding protein
VAIRIMAKVDKFGRIVIPKKIRQELGIRDNSAVFIETGANGLLLKPEKSVPFIKDMDGIIVVCSEASGDFSGFLDEEREKRIKKIAGEMRD